MKINKIGLLNEKHISQLSIIPSLKESGLECVCTDLARILGTQYKNENGACDYWIDGSTDPKKKAPSMMLVSKEGNISYSRTDVSTIGVRLAINFDDITDFNLDELESLECEFPLFAINGIVGETLDKLFDRRSKLVRQTGRTHDVCNTLYDEYEVFGIKFIKMQNKSATKLLSDGTLVDKDKTTYLKVENIPLIPDEEARILYSYVALFPMELDSSNSDVKSSKLSKYLNGKFLSSINDELEHKEPTLEEPEQINESNRYGFNFGQISEEEIIENCINSNIAVFLHGKTGTGKTERMVSLDRTLELIDFGCTSADGFTGIVAKDFNSKELFLYEPYWYKNLCKKCQDAPELFHILFLEELTNAKSDVQKVAFEVTLNRTLTNSGFRLKLPPNAVVCAAGNEASESRSANAMSEPLFGRFAHVYIDTDSDEWLKWALKRKKEGKTLEYKEYEERETIHPAIIDYIKINGDKVLRTPYDGVKPNADPRKWAMASKALYESNNPNILRAFVGETVTADFIKFCKINMITVDDILNDRCTAESIPVDPSLKWYTTLCLSGVDDENVDKVRGFVAGIGKEFLAMFDYEWSKDNDQRVMKLFRENSDPTAHVKKMVPYGNKQTN